MRATLSRSIPWLVFIAVLAVIEEEGNAFDLTVAMVTCLAVIMSQGMNVIMGFGGLVNLAVGAFYGAGAYTAAVLNTRYDIGLWRELAVAVAASALVAAVIGPFILRTRGLYFAIATMAVSAIFAALATNWVSVSGGAIGIPGVIRPVSLPPFGFDMSGLPNMFIAVAVVTVLVTAAVAWMRARRFGRVLVSIREDELLARSLGYRTLAYKVAAFAVSAVMAAIAGVMYADAIQYVSPSPFTFLTGGVQAFVIVAVGGGATVWGPVVGAALMVGAPEYLDFSANENQYIYAVGLLICVVFLRDGVVGGLNRSARRLFSVIRSSGDGPDRHGPEPGTPSG